MKKNTLSQKLQNFQPLQTEQMQKVKGGDDKRPVRPIGGGLPGGGTLPNGLIGWLAQV